MSASRIQRFLRQHWSILILIAIVVLALWARFPLIGYPLTDTAQGEPSRDYLVANHILSFHEWPLTGPWNGFFSGFLNSPSYYYLIAFFLLFRNSIVFLVLVNILLQVITGILLYILGYKLFSESTGLSAALLFLFSNENIFFHSQYFWQPYVMQVVLILAFLLICMSFQNKRIGWLLAGISAFIFATSLHMSALGILPVFGVAAAASFKRMDPSQRKYPFVISTAVGSLFLLYGPLLFFNHPYDPADRMINLNGLTTASLGPYWLQFRLVLLKMAEVFVRDINFHSAIAIIFAGLLLAKSLIGGGALTRTKLCFITAGIFILPIMLAFAEATYHRFYFIPIFGLVILLLAGVIDDVFSGSARVFKWIVVAGFFILISGKLSFLDLQSRGPYNSTIEQAVSAVAHFDILSFSVAAYAQESENAPALVSMHPALLIAPLENYFKLPLSNIDTFLSSGYELSNNNSKRMLILCRGLELASKDICAAQFHKDHPGYTVEREIFYTYPLLILIADK